VTGGPSSGGAPAPLAGARVLDLTRLLPGNYCAWLLASLGADVVKVEDPGAGDYMRRIGTQVGGMGAANQLVNRNKRSVVVDLKHPDGRLVFRRLVESADVLVESFRPGVLARHGFDAGTLHELNPKLVYAPITGYGMTGPWRDRAGHDLNYLGSTGLLDQNGPAGGDPIVPPIPLADIIGGGLVPALGILALLLEVRATGTGRTLDASITDAVALLPNLAVAEALAGAAVPGRGEADYSGGLACYGVYRLTDGYAAVAALEEKFWAEICSVLGMPELVEAHDDRERQGEVATRLREAFGAMSRADVERRFGSRDTCVSVVDDYATFATSALARERRLVEPSPWIDMRLLAAPFMVDGARPGETSPAPRQGEHTREVLGEAGLGETEIERLLESGAVRGG
jgi:crotonobetainyl-CoA:carnitine CoA-transferase CaiB-like acyl-CoA transferase